MIFIYGSKFGQFGFKSVHFCVKMLSNSSESEPKMKAGVLRGQVEALLRRGGDWGRTAIMRELPGTVSEATLKRILHGMIIDGAVESTGRGRATRYRFSAAHALLAPIDADAYFRAEIDERHVREHFNFELLRETLPSMLNRLFTAEELTELYRLEDDFRRRYEDRSPEERRRELTRLGINLSWKSSQIEGNTYTLLETERLLREQQTAEGRTRDEATMLLNHKAALDFLLSEPDYLAELSISRAEDIHSILIRDLGVERNLRTRRVGITGTNYRPPEHDFQIREAMEAACQLVNTADNPFSKALLALALISYIQPFTDGNKRTARLCCNALLISHHCCPLSFRTVSALDYKKACLLFYEQNNPSSLKSILVEQTRFAVSQYF